MTTNQLSDVPEANPIVFLDTETTSLLPERRVWEVAMIRRDATGEYERRFFVKNVDLASADQFSLRVGGFYDRHPQYAPPAAAPARVPRALGPERNLLERYEAAVEVERATRGATIIGCVPNFDTEALARMLRAVNLTPAWDYHLVDVRSVALGWLAACTGGPVSSSLGSDNLAALCGVEPPSEAERHTALGDARWVRRWWDALSNGPSLRGAPVATVTPLTARSAHGGAQ